MDIEQGQYQLGNDNDWLVRWVTSERVLAVLMFVATHTHTHSISSDIDLKRADDRSIVIDRLTHTKKRRTIADTRS